MIGGALAISAAPASAAPSCTTTCFVNGATGNDSNAGDLANPLQTIQAAVAQVSAGGTVSVAAGTYVENVSIPKSVTITGAGGSTIVEPATSNPNCNGGGSGSLCTGGTAASSVFLVAASSVTISQLTVDGDNPGITSGVTAGGADLNARNGIITSSAGVFNALSVHDVTVKNIYLRGIYALSGGSFNFTNNTVSNVQADPASIAMFDFGGSGVFSGNHVSGANDGISANHSTGTQFTNNTVTASASGIHTDNNGDSGGVADVISGNHVTTCTAGGYGIWTFVPYLSPTITNNTVSGCDVGLAAFASCAISGAVNCPGSVVPATTFSNNTVTSTGTLNSAAFYVSTTSFGFGDGDVHVNADHNVISGPASDVYVEETGTAHATVAANRNSVTGLINSGTTSVNATCNWWGQATGPSGQVTGPATTTPFLGSSDLSGPCPVPPPVSPAAVPSAPRLVSGVPGNKAVTAFWSPPASNGGSPITGYVVTAYKGGVAQTPVTFGAGARTGAVTGLTNGTTYVVKVAAKTVAGTGAQASTGMIVAGAPGRPGKVKAAHGAVAGRLKVTFTVPLSNGSKIAGYTAICRSSDGGAVASQARYKSPIGVDGVTIGKRYTCTVIARNARGSGPKSVPSNAVIV